MACFTQKLLDAGRHGPELSWAPALQEGLLVPGHDAFGAEFT